MKWSELVLEAHETALSKGWHEGEALTPTRAAALLALIHDEVSEAWFEEPLLSMRPIDWKAEKPHHFVFELADIVIRLADLYGLFGWNCYDFVVSQEMPSDSRKRGACAVHYELSDCILRPLRDGDEPLRCGPSIVVAECLGWLVEHSESEDAVRADFIRAIRHKMDYNKTRSHRHGGKSL